MAYGYLLRVIWFTFPDNNRRFLFLLLIPTDNPCCLRWTSCHQRRYTKEDVDMHLCRRRL